MSSILDALEKVEAAERWKPGTVAPRPERRSKLRLAAFAVGVAFAAGAGVAAFVLRSPQRSVAPEPAGVAPAAPTPTVADAPALPAPPAAAEAPPVAAPPTPAAPPVAAGEPPIAIAAVPPPPPAAAPAVPASAEAVSATPPPAAPAVPPPTAACAAPPPAAVATPAPPPPRVAPSTPDAPRPSEPAAAAPVAPAEEPRAPVVAAVEPRNDNRPVARPAVRLSFLVYSPSAERRSVVLAMDGTLVTLHEGESAGNVEVARILPDAVELRYEGRLFTVRPRD